MISVSFETAGVQSGDVEQTPRRTADFVTVDRLVAKNSKLICVAQFYSLYVINQPVYRT